MWYWARDRHVKAWLSYIRARCELHAGAKVAFEMAGHHKGLSRRHHQDEWSKCPGGALPWSSQRRVEWMPRRSRRPIVSMKGLSTCHCLGSWSCCSAGTRHRFCDGANVQRPPRTGLPPQMGYKIAGATVKLRTGPGHPSLSETHCQE